MSKIDFEIDFEDEDDPTFSVPPESSKKSISEEDSHNNSRAARKGPKLLYMGFKILSGINTSDE